jgi:hypothetical protein
MPGLLGFKPDARPDVALINVVYSNGNHYDALFYLVGEQQMLCACRLLHEQMVHRTQGVVCLDKDMEEEVPSAVVAQQHRLVSHVSEPDNGSCPKDAQPPKCELVEGASACLI